ncbi:MAG: ATP-binding protein [Bacteroidetes bacterium]|nr:ATP-binding protein [Bacteroidota bacterium]MCL5738517.1 ATP-binding protein [Bacteroidota bacterium]
MKNSALVVPQDLLRLFEGFDEGIVVTNRFGEIVVMNRASERIFGVGKDINLHKNSSILLSGLYDPETKKQILATNLLFNQAIATERPVASQEFLLKHPDGKDFYVQISTCPIFGEDNSLTGTLGILIDVTERRKLEETLTQRNLQLSAINRIAMLLNRTIDFREVLEYSVRQTMDIFTGDAGAILLPDKSERKIFVAASANLNEDFLSEVHGSELTSTIFGRVLKSDTVESVNRSENFSTGSFGEGMPRSLRKSPFDSVVVFPLKAKGKAVGVGALFSEVERVLEDSQREIMEGIGTVIGAAIENSRLHEETIQKTRLLESKNHELQQFTYAITHDLKSPILVIEGFARELKRSAHLEVEQEVLIEAILGSSARLHSLVNDLLDLARVGSVEVVLEEADMGELVNRVLGDLSIRLSEKKIKVALEGNFPKLYIVIRYIERVFTNLIDNAIKYMGDQPSPQLVIGAQDKGDHFLFFVRDNGIGIPQEFHERVFAIFQRVKTNETEKVEGSGLGLSFVKKIVELSGGTVWVESAGKGKGATFYFTLPKQ